MATYTSLSVQQAQEIGRAFGLTVQAVTGVPAGSVNSNYRLTLAGGTPVFARIYEEQGPEGAEGEARLLDHLAGHGVATPRPLSRGDGRGFTLTVELAGADGSRPRAVALFPWRAGEMLCQASVTPAVVQVVGRKLAEIHVALATFPERRPGRFGLSDLRERLDRVARGGSPELAAAVPGIRERLTAAEHARADGLPRGIIHGDLFRDNVLWEGGEIGALLDFESACDGAFAYDVAVTALAWCFGADLDHALVRSLLAGYVSARPLDTDEIQGLAAEARIAALRFTVTRITDFEMRKGSGGVFKDWRRFFARHEQVLELGTAQWARWMA
jgi:homoserine kinase type II